MTDLGLDFVDAVYGEGAAVSDGVGSRLWDQAELRQGLGGGDLDGQPALVFVGVGPDAAHLGTGVAGDQAVLLRGKSV